MRFARPFGEAAKALDRVGLPGGLLFLLVPCDRAGFLRRLWFASVATGALCFARIAIRNAGDRL